MSPADGSVQHRMGSEFSIQIELNAASNGNNQAPQAKRQGIQRETAGICRFFVGRNSTHGPLLKTRDEAMGLLHDPSSCDSSIRLQHSSAPWSPAEVCNPDSTAPVHRQLKIRQARIKQPLHTCEKRICAFSNQLDVKEVGNARPLICAL
jgi:hypothetical protein